MARLVATRLRLAALLQFVPINTDIDSLCDWSDDNHLQFSGTKCKFMVISRKRQPILPPQPLSVNRSQLERVHSYKYLGVWLTSTLNWSTHITEISKKAQSQLGIVYRNVYQHSNSATLLQLYFSLGAKKFSPNILGDLVMACHIPCTSQT